jgi:hypothetical protein
MVEAFLAVTHLMLLAADRRVPVLVKAAFVSEAHKYILSKPLRWGEGLSWFQASSAGKTLKTKSCPSGGKFCAPFKKG